jgi:hypothetical protein
VSKIMLIMILKAIKSFCNNFIHIQFMTSVPSYHSDSISTFWTWSIFVRSCQSLRDWWMSTSVVSSVGIGLGLIVRVKIDAFNERPISHTQKLAFLNSTDHTEGQTWVGFLRDMWDQPQKVWRNGKDDFPSRGILSYLPIPGFQPIIGRSKGEFFRVLHISNT